MRRAAAILCAGILISAASAQVTTPPTGIIDTTGIAGVTDFTGTTGITGTTGTTPTTTTGIPGTVTGGAPVNPVVPSTITDTNTQVGGFDPLRSFVNGCGTGAVSTLAFAMVGLALMKGRRA